MGITVYLIPMSLDPPVWLLFEQDLIFLWILNARMHLFITQNIVLYFKFFYFEFIRWPGRTEAKWLFLCTYWCFYLKDLVNFISNCSVALLEDAEEKGYISNMRMMRQKLEKLDMDIEICTPGQYNHLLCPMVFRYFPSAPTFSLLFCFYSLLVVVFYFV